MSRFTLSFKVWWRVLTDERFADQVRPLYDARALPAPQPQPSTAGRDAATTAKAATPAAPREPARSDALNLLAVLQREARLIDFLKEDIAPYSNEQVGAAVRDVHTNAAAALQRMFALQAVNNQPEGAPVEVPSGFDAARIRLIGDVAGPAPYRGILRHSGWEATKVQLPEWSGTEQSARVIAPAEVEVT